MTQTSVPEQAQAEQRALWLGAWSGLALGGLGFVFAIITGSDAILLDGVFSLVGFGVALATIRVSQVIRRPANDSYQFGFAGFESLIILVRGLVMGIVGLFAMVSSGSALFQGGRTVSAGSAVVYSAIAAAGCVAVALMLRGAARRTGSPILALDVRAWLIDAGMSAGVGLAFLVTYLIRDGSLSWLVPYVDPGLVVLLSLTILPVPLRIVREGLHQLLGGAPEPGLQDQIHDLLAAEFASFEEVTPRVRMLQAGRVVYVQVYLIVPAHVEIGDVTLLDAVREQIDRALSSRFPDLTLDVVFTGDGKWLQRSVGGSVAEAASAEATIAESP